MSDDISLSVEKRDILGKKVKNLRRDGRVPAVIHDHGRDSVHITLDQLGFKKVYSAAGKNHPVNLKAGQKNYITLIKDVTYMPGSSQIYHVVLQAVKADEKVSAEIPVHLVGDSPAEQASLQILQKIDHINVEALPKDLPESFEVDTAVLEDIGDRISIGDIKIGANVEIIDDTENLIAIVEEPKDQIAEADKALEEQKEAEEKIAEEGEEGAEGEEESEEGESEEAEGEESGGQSSDSANDDQK